MKHCPRCNEWLAFEAFARRRGNKRQSWCRDCAREYQRGRPRILLARRLVREAKNGPCKDCGIQYPYYVMDFDHRPGEGKRANLTVLAKQGVSREVLLAEMARCDLVCANCHRMRTYRRKKEREQECSSLL